MKSNFSTVVAGCFIAAFLIGTSLASADFGISTSDLTSIFESMNFDNPRDPISPLGISTRRNIQSNLQLEFSRIASTAGGSSNGHQDLKQTYQTQVYSSPSRVEIVEGINYIVVLQGSTKNASEDEPIVILANYDTDMNPHHIDNVVDDNGSGVVALLALGRHLASQISTGKVHLKRTLILAATDTALSKYEYGVPVQGLTGAGKLLKDWLQRFLGGRKFGGAIVLDSIMNFDDSLRSQVDSSTDFSKSFPSAYKKMSESEFRGNFLALVQREGEVDSGLAEGFARGWAHAQKQLKDSDVIANPELITFSFTTNQSYNSEAEGHFLRSEQTPFWKVGGSYSNGHGFPAILLTDTQKYRKSPCTSIAIQCTHKTMGTPGNLAFLRTNVMAVYSTILGLQADGFPDNGVSKASFSIVTLLLLLAGVLFHEKIMNIC